MVYEKWSSFLRTKRQSKHEERYRRFAIEEFELLRFVKKQKEPLFLFLFLLFDFATDGFIK